MANTPGLLILFPRSHLAGSKFTVFIVSQVMKCEGYCCKLGSNKSVHFACLVNWKIRGCYGIDNKCYQIRLFT